MESHSNCQPFHLGRGHWEMPNQDDEFHLKRAYAVYTLLVIVRFLKYVIFNDIQNI